MEKEDLLKGALMEAGGRTSQLGLVFESVSVCGLCIKLCKRPAVTRNSVALRNCSFCNALLSTPKLYFHENPRNPQSDTRGAQIPIGNSRF